MIKIIKECIKNKIISWAPQYPLQLFIMENVLNRVLSYAIRSLNIFKHLDKELGHSKTPKSTGK